MRGRAGVRVLAGAIAAAAVPAERLFRPAASPARSPMPEHRLRTLYDPLPEHAEAPSRSVRVADIATGFSAIGAAATGAVSAGAAAVGALALGSLALGALAIGAFAIGRLSVRRAHVRRLVIDDLTVRRLRLPPL